MTTATVSSKGQITLPAQARRTLGIKPRSKVEVEVKNREIVVRPVRSVREVYGIFHEYARDKTDDWETIRRLTEEAIAREVMGEDEQ